MVQQVNSKYTSRKSPQFPPDRYGRNVGPSTKIPPLRVAVDTYLLETFTSDSTSTHTNTTQDEGSVNLSSVDSWLEKRFTQLDIKEAAWMLEPRGESGPSGCRGRVGSERLDRWMEQVRQMNADRERTEEEERKKRRRRRWLGMVGRRSDENVSVATERRDGIKVTMRSCASDKVITKKRSKLFRARRRAANLSRRVKRPVESVAAEKRFVIK